MAKKAVVAIAVLAFIAVLAVAAASNLLNIGPFEEIPNAVPHEVKYGILRLGLCNVKSKVILHHGQRGLHFYLETEQAGRKACPRPKIDGINDENTEIVKLYMDG